MDLIPYNQIDTDSFYLIVGGNEYPLGCFNKAVIINSIVLKIKGHGINVNLNRLFDFCLLTIESDKTKALALLAYLASSRDISIKVILKSPSNDSIQITINNLFAGNHKHLGFSSNMNYRTELQVFCKSNTIIGAKGQLPFTQDNENFRLNDPLLSIYDAISDLKDTRVRRLPPK